MLRSRDLSLGAVVALVEFYEKPGCQTNRKQEALLTAAGHEVVARDLLSEPWTAERLRAFFGDAPVVSWFNPAAPRVKSGEVNPEDFDADAAVAAMLAEPLLIRRPLIHALGMRCAGFDREPVLTLVGTEKKLADAQRCSRPTAPACSPPRDIS